MTGCDFVRMISVYCFGLASVSTQALAETAVGTGFFVNSGGWFVSNQHVVNDCDAVKIDGFGNAVIVSSDQANDLALLRVNTTEDVHFLSLRLTEARLAEAVATLGFPLSGLLSQSIKVTTGSVSSLAGIGDDERYLQISAPVQPGNSGGPVIDSSGNVVGVVTGTLSEQAFAQAQNVNFAIKAGVVAEFLENVGIQYTIADHPDQLVDISTAATSAALGTAQIFCFQKKVPSPNETDPLQSQGFTFFREKDVLGFDYRTLRNATSEICQNECAMDPECVAFTFNQRYEFCFLKNQALITIDNVDALSGVRSSLGNQVMEMPFEIRANVDSVGGDYLRLKGTDFIECFLECATSTRCQAFAYVRRTRDCWLKDHVGQISVQPGVEFGFK